MDNIDLLDTILRQAESEIKNFWNDEVVTTALGFLMKQVLHFHSPAFIANMFPQPWLRTFGANGIFDFVAAGGVEIIAFSEVAPISEGTGESGMDFL